MTHYTSLFDIDAGYYEYLPNFWLPGRMVPGTTLTWSRKAVDAAINLDLKDSDVMSATYPKSGQTWTLMIIRLMMLAKDLEDGKEVDTRDLIFRIPFIESEVSDGTLAADIFNGLSSPRYMKTHLPFELWKQQLEKHPDIKIIQTIRNPKDTLVSWYHHCRSDSQLGAFHGTWDQYFEMFKEKKLPWGDYFEHTTNWYKFNKDRQKSLVLIYEDMKRSHRDHVIKIASFLGYNLSEKVIDIIVNKSTFKDMSKTMKDFPGWKSDRSSFIRKGEVGDWVNYFSEEQSKFIDAKCKEHLEPFGLKFEYGNENKLSHL